MLKEGIAPAEGGLSFSCQVATVRGQPLPPHKGESVHRPICLCIRPLSQRCRGLPHQSQQDKNTDHPLTRDTDIELPLPNGKVDTPNYILLGRARALEGSRSRKKSMSISHTESHVTMARSLGGRFFNLNLYHRICAHCSSRSYQRYFDLIDLLPSASVQNCIYY